MNRKYWLLLSLAPVAGALSVACTSEFSSCEARRNCPAGGSAGKGAAGTGGAAGIGGAGEGDTGGAGEAGTGGVGVGAAGVEEGGNEEGGTAEEGGTSDVSPVLFSACSVKGEFACVGRAGAQRLACDGQLWQAGTTCGAGQLCNSSDGTCAPIVAECASAKPGAVVCRKDTLLTCGPDLVTASEGKTCDGLCNLGVCQAAICGDKKTEKGEDCDDAAGNDSGICVKCKAATCGDGAIYEGHEQCDDGNKVSGDGCSATCRAEPVELALGDGVTCARSSTGLVKCWGYNHYGTLGVGDTSDRGDLPSTVPSKLSAIDLGTGRKAKAISAGGTSVCALLVEGDVKCWGNNDYGQLGTGNTTNRGDEPGEMGQALNSIPLGVGQKAIGVSAGASHTCVVLEGGDVKCWGSGYVGQLGQGSLTDWSSPEHLSPIELNGKAKAVSASSYIYGRIGGGGATCALLVDGTVKCWGNTFAVPHDSSTDLNASSAIGDSVGEISGLPALRFSGGRLVKSVVAGFVSAAILDDGSLRLWGFGPALASPDFSSSEVGLTLTELASLPAVQMGKSVKSIALSRRHACAVLDDGAVKCWGEGSAALGLGSGSPTEGTALKDLAPVNLGGHAALQLAIGEYHACAILDDGTLKCWGDNGSGELGLGDAKGRGDTGDKLSADTTVDLSF